MNCGPSVYSVKTSPARSVISSHFIQASAYFLQALFLGRVDALVGEVARLDLPHLLLDLLEVLGRERSGAVEIVVKAVVDGRADAELGLGIQLEHRRRQQVRGRVPVHLERLGILGGQDLQAGVLSRGRVRSYSSPLTLATMAASASRGLIDLAMSMGACPAATDCLLPSGRVISMLLIGNFQRSTGEDQTHDAGD